MSVERYWMEGKERKKVERAARPFIRMEGREQA